MRQLVTKCGFILIMAVMVLAQACSPAAQQSPDPPRQLASPEPYDGSYAVAVILTNPDSDFTYIEYFDSELNLVNTIRYPYSQLHSGSALKPPSLGDVVYVIPTTLMGLPGNSMVVSIDLATGSITVYRVDLAAIDGLAVGDDYLLAVSYNEPGVRGARIDLASGEVVYLVDEPWLLGNLLTEAGRLYSIRADIGLDNTGIVMSLWLIDEQLATVDQVDLNALGINFPTFATEPFDGGLFFVTSVAPEEESETGYLMIHLYSPVDGSIQPFASTVHGYTEDLLVDGDKLLFFGSLADERLTGFVDIYDIAGGELIGTADLDYAPPYKALVHDGCLYVLAGSGPDCLLVKYGLEDGTYVELARVSLAEVGSAAELDGFTVTEVFSR